MAFPNGIADALTLEEMAPKGHLVQSHNRSCVIEQRVADDVA
jgi:hypothetical protein